MENSKASDLLNQYLSELEGFEAGLKAWFSDLEHEKDPKKLTSCSYSTPSQQLQLYCSRRGRLTQVWQKLSDTD